MNNALAVRELNDEQLIPVLQTSLYPGAAIDSIRMVIGYCKAANLDPIQKPVHIVPMWDSKSGVMRDVVMPGIGSYRIQASRSGCAGISEPEFGPDVTRDIGGQTITFPQWCRVTVKRVLPSGDVAEFTAKELWTENYAVKGGKEKSIAPNAMWTKRPYGQLAKCAEAQALRKAFPEVGSLPTAEEMEGKTTDDFHGTTIDGATGEIIKPKVERPALPAYPQERFDANKAQWQTLIQTGEKTPEAVIAMLSSKYTLSAEQADAIRAMKEPA